MAHQEKLRSVGLARALSKLGYCSRAQAGEMIARGRVRLNGKVRRDAEAAVHLGRDRIEVDSELVREQSKIYLILNKPRGVVTTASDEKGRRTVYEFLPAHPWVGPVGRLDQASEGLLLLTNDTEWGARLADPSSGIEKVYHVQVGTTISDSLVEQLVGGLVESGEALRAKRARVIRRGQRNSWIEIVLEEGKNRHIRRMLAALDTEVLRLVRVEIGGLSLGHLAKGCVQALNAEEKRDLERAIRTVEP